MLHLFVSDIHGAKSSALKIKELDQKFNFKSIFLLGDINYNGARNVPPSDYSPLDVTKILNSINKDKMLFIRGNCDSRVDEYVLDKEFYDYKRIKINKLPLFLTHGDLFSKCNVHLKRNEVFVYGHTHIFEMIEYQKHLIVNPGSISLPKNNNPRSYIIFDDENMTFSLYNINDELLKEFTLIQNNK